MLLESSALVKTVNNPLYALGAQRLGAAGRGRARAFLDSREAGGGVPGRTAEEKGVQAEEGEGARVSTEGGGGPQGGQKSGQEREVGGVESGRRMGEGFRREV